MNNFTRKHFYDGAIIGFRPHSLKICRIDIMDPALTKGIIMVKSSHFIVKIIYERAKVCFGCYPLINSCTGMIGPTL